MLNDLKTFVNNLVQALLYICFAILLVYNRICINIYPSKTFVKTDIKIKTYVNLSVVKHLPCSHACNKYGRQNFKNNYNH
jgi:hypothetical protein